MRKIVFEKTAFFDFTEWSKSDKKIFAKIVALISNILSTPFTGIGKPEPLKHQLKGYWSRRINQEHRLVYKITDDALVIISCRYHYK